MELSVQVMLVLAGPVCNIAQSCQISISCLFCSVPSNLINYLIKSYSRLWMQNQLRTSDKTSNEEKLKAETQPHSFRAKHAMLKVFNNFFPENINFIDVSDGNLSINYGFYFSRPRHRRRDARTKLLRISWSWRISVPQPSLVSPASSLACHKPRIPTISTISAISTNLQVSVVSFTFESTFLKFDGW